MTVSVPLKRLISLRRPITYGIVQAGADTPGGVPYVRPTDMTARDGVRDMDSLLRTTVEIAAAYTRSTILSGDVVLSIGPSYGKVMVVPEALSGANLTQGTARLAPGPDSDPRFLYWAVQTTFAHDFWDLSVAGATFKALNLEPLSRTPIPLWTLEVQRRIADFLDHQVPMLDRAIALRHQQAALLVERQGSLVDETVRALMNGHPLIPVKYLTREMDERLGTREPPHLLSVSIHLGVIPRSQITDKEPRADDLAGYKVCAPGDIVLNRMRAFQGGVGVARTDGLVSPDYAVLRPVAGVMPEWLDMLFRSGWFVSEMTRRLRGVGGIDQGTVRTPRINVADLGMIKVPDLKTSDQRNLIETLTGGHYWRGDIAALGSRQADLFGERREALITAAVTGQFDVTTARSVA